MFDFLGRSSCKYLTRKPDKVDQLDQTFVSQISDPWVFSSNETSILFTHMCCNNQKKVCLCSW